MFVDLNNEKKDVVASDRRETRVPLSARDKLRNLTYSELN